tara:strand:+ start:2193 stop:2414 length:222 start_codon:yes stop_codon:yes gene_type:complete
MSISDIKIMYKLQSVGVPVRENILHVLSDIVTSNIVNEVVNEMFLNVYDISYTIIDDSIAEPITKFLRGIYDE